MGIAISGWLDRFDPTVLADIQTAQFGFLNCGHSVWSKIPEIEQACGSFIDGYGLRFTDKPLYNRWPSGAMFADWQCNHADSLVQLGVPKHKLYLIGLDEEHENAYATGWDTAHCDRVHLRGYKVSGGHYSFGWDFNKRSTEEQDRIIVLWSKWDIVARHSYRGWMFNADPPRFADDLDTIFAPHRWREWPHEKWLPCEAGVDFWAAHPGDSWQGEGSPGFRAVPITERAYAHMMLQLTIKMQDFGALGLGHFAVRTQNETEWANFYGSSDIYNYWRQTVPKLVLPGGTMPIKQADLDAAQRQIEEVFFKVQRAWNSGKTNASYEEMGRELETIFNIAGDGVNTTDAAFKELAKKL